MTFLRSANTRLLLRVIIYLLIIVVLYNVRGGSHWRRLLHRIPGLARADTTLILAGSDLAPVLVEKLAYLYGGDYPDLEVRIQGGGTYHALEDLINDRADVAFLCRAPSQAEQELFRSVDGDTALCYPIALGGIVLLRGENSPVTAVSLPELRGYIYGEIPGETERTGAAGPAWQRLYCPDPNLGLWDAVLASLELSPTLEPIADRVIFLPDEESVLQQVAMDEHGLGLASSLTLPVDLTSHTVTTVPLLQTQDMNSDISSIQISPRDEDIASGHYPLHHYLFVSCPSRGNIQGGKFVTHVTSDHGQRQIQRAGFIPARLVLREVFLTRKPLGE